MNPSPIQTVAQMLAQITNPDTIAEALTTALNAASLILINELCHELLAQLKAAIDQD